MFCPQCGQQQIADNVRFCSRCGFLLEGVSTVMAAGGMVPGRYAPRVPKGMSPRSKGVRQGAMLMLSTALIVPLLAILTVNFFGNPEVIVPLAALICFVGGLLRILYAVIMEDANPPIDISQATGYAQGFTPQLDASMRPSLPPASSSPVGWRARPNTAEIYQPPSITENTTRLLDKDDPNNR
ncbi:MAG TPA: zinc ribbon domain-containing protein [Pyrinomonadaceae bacterium]|nr:zinc ribbon domain-containing protein [Pyrinomonadaceae bacterium]